MEIRANVVKCWEEEHIERVISSSIRVKDGVNKGCASEQSSVWSVTIATSVLVGWNKYSFIKQQFDSFCVQHIQILFNSGNLTNFC